MSGRPSKVQWLIAWLLGVCASGPDGRYEITVDVHRHSISHIRINKVEKVTEC